MAAAKPTSFFARITALEPPPPWGITTVSVTVVVAFAAIIVGTIVGQTWFAGGSFASLVGWTLGCLLMMLFVVQSRRGKGERAALRLNPAGAPLPLVMLICFGCAITFDLLGLAVTGAFLPIPELAGVTETSLPVWVIAATFMLLAQPLGEELVFRGVAFPVFRQVGGAWGGLVASAAVYAVFHFAAYPPAYIGGGQSVGVWYGLLLPFLDGMVISLVRAHTGSTRSAVAAHAAFGIFALIKLITLSGGA